MISRSSLALDLGTITGWAINLDGIVQAGTWNLKGGRYEGGGMRFLRFRRQLEDMHEAADFGSVHYEEVRRHLGTDAAHIYGGLLGTLTAWCEERDIPYMGIPVATIKRHATGRGNADKRAMIESAKARGWTPEDDNQADALWILDYATGLQPSENAPRCPERRGMELNHTGIAQNGDR
jgi:hypothetical protein